MIDFRYHIVSIIAVFLALAVGIVVGTTALNGYVVDSLRASNSKVIHDKRGLEASVRDLRNQVSRREDFVTAVAPEVVSGELADERVLFVTTPGAADSVVKQLTALVTQAGAQPVGVLALKNDLLDPSKAQVVDDVVAGVVPAGVELPDGTPVDKAAVELAAALLQDPGRTALPSDAAAKVIGGFQGADLIDLRSAPGTKSSRTQQTATLAVIVTGGGNGTPVDDVTQQRQRAVLTLARAMDARSAGVVVVGPESAAEPGGLLAAARSDGPLSDRVSTVDTVDAAFGAVSTILALREQLSGSAGSYGQGPGADAAVPSQSPSPTPAP
jgi:hypothetical protein